MRPEQITGLVLAGGRGSRMGGVDKGLQLLQGRPLVAHVLERLAPQVGALMINANRSLDAYSAYGHPVLSDADDSFSGPLAGMLAGLRAMQTDWLLAVPCDSPRLPLDLAARLSADIGAARLALPLQSGRLQPVFCLLHRSLAPALEAYLQAGGRKLESWMCAQPHRQQSFAAPGDELAFFNANTLAELQQLEGAA